MHKKQRGKQHNFNSNIKTFPIKIKTLFAYLEKLLHILNILQFYIFAISKQLFYIKFIEKRYFFIEIFAYVRNLL